MSGDLDLDAISARADAATPGPWDNDGNGDISLPVGHPQWDDFLLDIHIESHEFQADAEFIAHARTDIPQLIAEVERLRGRIEDEL